MKIVVEGTRIINGNKSSFKVHTISFCGLRFDVTQFADGGFRLPQRQWKEKWYNIISFSSKKDELEFMVALEAALNEGRPQVERPVVTPVKRVNLPEKAELGQLAPF